MVICNRERVKVIESDMDSDLDACPKNKDKCCENKLDNPDLIDFRTEMDQLSFYEKTDFQPCDDLWLIANEECLWQCIVGEIKTPLHALKNSIGQADYGCDIWSVMGKNIDVLDVKQFEKYIIDTCLKYPEVKNVIGIETKIGTELQSFLCHVAIDSIYGTFDGHIRIPNAKPTEKTWIPSDRMFHRDV